MIDINELRRLTQAAIAKMSASDPEFASSTPPLAILELLDRLEAAEKERDVLLTAVRHEADCVEAAMAEIKSLRAKIEAMEKQEPAAWYYTTNDAWDCYSREKPPEDATDVDSLRPLYLAPGAQPAQSVPDGWLKHAAHMATLAKKLREPDWCLESIREMQRELRTLEEAALAAASGEAT